MAFARPSAVEETRSQMRVEERSKRRRDGAKLPSDIGATAIDPVALRVLQMQRAAGNQAVGRVLAREIRVTPVDYNPESQRLIHSTVEGGALKTQIRQAQALYDVLTGPERQRLDKLHQQTLQGTDVPTLADAIIGYLAAGTKGRAAAIGAQKSLLEEAIAAVAQTKANPAEKGHFRQVQGMASHMSRNKGTPNTLPWAQVTGDLRSAVTTLAAKLQTRNQYLAGTNYAALDPTQTSTGRATFQFDQVRSPHQNRAGWLQGHAAPNVEAALDTAAQAWLANIRATGSAAAQAQINQKFPLPALAPFTSRQVEDSTLPAVMRQHYLNNDFAQTAATGDDRITLAWSRYAEDFMAGCPYIEFTAEDAGGVSRFIYDYINDELYANTHYNWVDGFSPFFHITGGPAMR
jgi:hypothetical protein